jgi:hypothetical protein
MAKATMQKWQRDWFLSELDKKYDNEITAQELKLKSIIADATEKAEKNLAKKIGADKVIKELEEALEIATQKMSKAARFFRSTNYAKKDDVSYKFRENTFSITGGYGSNKILPDDCWEQVRSWASKFAEAQVDKTPEGKQLKILRDNKHAGKKAIMEAGSPDELKTKLNENVKCIGQTWDNSVKALPSVHN